jgi:hypothetical protein
MKIIKFIALHMILAFIGVLLWTLFALLIAYYHLY